MDLVQRLNQLESVRDWQGLAEELEKGIAGETDAAAKAQYHLRLGRVLEQKFLQGVKALKHFQDAFKLNPVLTEALENARSIYWDLGKVNMVQKLLELELKTVHEGPMATTLLLELGDVLCDQGDYEKATATYAKALGVSGGTSLDARACLEDLQLDESTWEAHLASILRQAGAGTGKSTGAPLSASRAHRQAGSQHRRNSSRCSGQGVRRRYGEQASGLDVREHARMEEERANRITEAQRATLDELGGSERARAAFRFGVRWATRHQNVEIGAKLLEESLEHDPTNEAAFAYLRELWGGKEGNWDRVMSLAEKAAGENGANPFMIAQAGTVAWRQLGNLMRARSWFEKLSAIAPEHPSLKAFELQIGHKLNEGVAPAHKPEASVSPAKIEPAIAPTPQPAPVAIASCPGTHARCARGRRADACAVVRRGVGSDRSASVVRDGHEVVGVAREDRRAQSQGREARAGEALQRVRRRR